jgi:BASS family bile acid:Na+ symporter
MPFGGYALAKLFHLPPELAVGLILTGAAPGAMASNVMSYLAKADTAYAVSLTTVTTLICPVLTPALTMWLAHAYMPIPFWPMFLTVVETVILPLFVGLAVRYWFRDAMRRIEKIFPAISVTFVVFICSLVIALNREYLAMLTGLILVVALLLNIGGMLGGYGVGTLFRLDIPKRRTLALEIGMQNAGLGSTLALTHLGPKAAVPCAIFVFVCILTASVMARRWSRRTKERLT